MFFTIVHETDRVQRKMEDTVLIILDVGVHYLVAHSVPVPLRHQCVEGLRTLITARFDLYQGYDTIDVGDGIVTRKMRELGTLVTRKMREHSRSTDT